jgi:hypothetical protein
VQPQHERRKYLSRGGTTLRFAGLGRRGRTMAARAAALGDSGFAATFISLRRGFLEQPWTSGRPLALSAGSTPPVIARLASYVAFLRRTFSTEQPDSIDELRAMAVCNASEGLGDWTAAALERLAAPLHGLEEPRVAVDGRMLPHEWIDAGDRLVKMDALDHHDDDFWPGCRDAAWDVAGAIAEFDWPPHASGSFVNAYARASGDHTIRQRLPFYLAAYLAYRQAYAALAAATLGDSADGRAFTALRQRYRRSLFAQLRRHAPG